MTNEIKNQIVSLLFISHKPLEFKELVKLVGAEKDQVQKALTEVTQEYADQNGGIQLIKTGSKYQFVTSPDSARVVEKFIKYEITGELTRPSLETLTIVAYRGPISKAELELIRGVNCSLILRNLLMRGLIEGQEDKERNIIMYKITTNFLKYLGIGQVEALPDYKKLNRNNNLEKLLVGLDNEN